MKSIPKYHTTVNRAECSALPHAISITPASSVRETPDGSANLRGTIEDGRIKGMSAHTLSRLRQTIATLEHNRPYRLYGLCFTIPWGGDAVTQEMGEDIWREWIHHIGRVLDKMQIGLLYRVELQANRKAPHWHLMAYLPDDMNPADVQRVLTRLCSSAEGGWLSCGFLPRRCRFKDDTPPAHLLALACLRLTWCKALQSYHDKAVPSAPTPPESGGMGADDTRPIIDMTIKTWEYCYHAQALLDSCAGMSYLAAHTGKHKQEQLGWKGRQWGIVGSKWLHEREPVPVADLSNISYRQRVNAFRLIRHWCKVNRPKGLWRVVRPRRSALPSGDAVRYVVRGLQVGNSQRLYLYGLPPAVISRAFACASLNVPRGTFC